MKKQGKILRGPPAKKIPDISLGQYLLKSMRANSSRPIQIDAVTGEVMTNRDLLERSVKLAGVLEARGVKIGDRIAISSENHHNWLVPACATLYIGAVLAPLNPTYTEWELNHILAISKPRIIFVSKRTEELFLKIAPKLSWATEIIQLDDEPITENVPSLKQLLAEYTKPCDPDGFVPALFKDNSKQVSAILCSSGTTGLPKGVTLSHRNFLTFLYCIALPEFLDIRRNDKLLVFLPFYHGYAMGLLMTAMDNGATAIVMRTFEPNVFLESIRKYKITHLPLVPPILVFLAKYPTLAQYDFSSVREVLCGAAPLPKDLVAEVKSRLNCQWIRNGYGMTELSIIISLSERSAEDDNVGPVVPGVLCKIADQTTNEPLGVREVGELCFKGEQVMLGYYGNPEATAQTIDSEGWLHSGDLGYFDEKEKLYVTGRVKELIKYKAFQVSPSEIEMVLLSHPEVKDAGVIGIPNDANGELPMAFVVKQPGTNPSPEEIVKFVNARLSPPKWLRGGVRFLNAIPKNPTGKVLRRELQSMASKL